MRLLVYPHDLSIGGSQINAIDLAAAAADAGHDVIVYGVPGPLVDYIHERKLRFLPAHDLKYRPAPSRIAQLAAIVRRYDIDLIHAYEWPTCLDAYFGAGVFLKTPIICTVLSMNVMPQVPASIPLIMGTAELTEAARRSHRGPVWTIEPPIDVHRDSPDIDGSGFRRMHDVCDYEFLVTSISRLAIDLKLDALVRAIDAVDMLAATVAIKLLLVGDGPAGDALYMRAAAVNRRHGREVIRLVGSMADPRAAYAAADLVVGMGSSALRALSIERPLIVQGEDAFSEIFEAGTHGIFLHQGFYGRGDSQPGPQRLVEQIGSLIADPAKRTASARFGRELVVERFSVERAAALQLDIYDGVLAAKSGWRIGDAFRSAGHSLMIEVENHHPFRKRNRQMGQRRLLLAAGSEAWPPSDGVATAS